VEAGSGALLFSGRLSDEHTDGLWLWQNGVVSLVALEGTGDGQFAALATDTGPYFFQMNDHNQAIFYGDDAY
jgi:hypothetical protein